MKRLPTGTQRTGGGSGPSQTWRAMGGSRPQNSQSLSKACRTLGGQLGLSKANPLHLHQAVGHLGGQSLGKAGGSLRKAGKEVGLPLGGMVGSRVGTESNGMLLQLHNLTPPLSQQAPTLSLNKAVQMMCPSHLIDGA